MVMHTFCPNIRDLETGRALNSIQVQSNLPSECQGHIVKSCLKKRNPVYKIRTFIPVTQRKKPGRQNKVLWPAIQSWLFMDSGKKRLNKKRKQKRNGLHWSRVLAPDEFFKKAKYKGKDIAESVRKTHRLLVRGMSASLLFFSCFTLFFFFRFIHLAWCSPSMSFLKSSLSTSWCLLQLSFYIFPVFLLSRLYFFPYSFMYCSKVSQAV